MIEMRITISLLQPKRLGFVPPKKIFMFVESSRSHWSVFSRSMVFGYCVLDCSFWILALISLILEWIFKKLSLFHYLSANLVFLSLDATVVPFFQAFEMITPVSWWRINMDSNLKGLGRDWLRKGLNQEWFMIKFERREMKNSGILGIANSIQHLQKLDQVFLEY